MVRSSIACLFIIHLAAGCQRNADAQEIRRDYLGPIQCFNIVQAKQLSEQSSLELCTGAISDAPGRCYAQALDQFQELSSQQVQQLCTRATSTEPVECYRRLDATEDLTEQQMIEYCAVYCPVGPPPPQSSSSLCLSQAMETTDLALQSAGELCFGSSTAGPVQCFLAGQNLYKVADSSLISLCRERVYCQYPGGSTTLGAGGYNSGY
jgi:hypothetical protein